MPAVGLFLVTRRIRRDRISKTQTQEESFLASSSSMGTSQAIPVVALRLFNREAMACISLGRKSLEA